MYVIGQFIEMAAPALFDEFALKSKTMAMHFVISILALLLVCR